MSLFTNLIKKSLEEFFHKCKKWLIVFSVIMGLLIGLNLIINYYVDKVVGTLIKEFVHEKSNGFYKVEFDEIAYLINNGRFFMTDFKFDIHPDHKENIHYEGLDQNYLYFATIPRLHIDIIEFWSIFINKKLRVIGVEIDSPVIKIINLNKNTAPKKLSFEAGNLYEVLSGHLTELKINNFQIIDGEFNYETYQGPDYDNFNVKGLTFEVKNFQVNEKAKTRTDKFFYTDDISLEVKDQEFYLKDSLHKVTFDRFYLSTLKNELGFENFDLTRRDNPLTDKNTHNHYEISLSLLRFSGIDFLTAYNDNLLKIDSIQINTPTVNIIKRVKGQQNKDSTKNSLLDIAMIYNDTLAVNHFNLEDAQLVYTDETMEFPKTYLIDHISAYLSDIKLDTGKYANFRYGIDFNKAEVMVKDYEVKLPDSVNTIKFDEFAITSDPFTITLKDLIMQPDKSMTSSEDKDLIFARLPYLAITNFDISRAIKMDTFIIEEIFLEHPELTLIPSASKKTKNQKLNPGGMFGVYHALQSFSDLFVVEKMIVENGKFKIKNNKTPNTQIDLTNIDLAINNIHVDDQTDTENDFFGDADIFVSLDKSSADLNGRTVLFKHLMYTSQHGRLVVDSLDFQSFTTAQSESDIHVQLPKLLLSGINSNKLLFEQEILLDTLKFQDVRIKINALEDAKSVSESKTNERPDFPVVRINQVIGENYRINYSSDGLPVFTTYDMDFQISNLLLDQSLSDQLMNQFDFEKIDHFSIRDYELYLKKQKHFFQTKQILWNGDQATFSMHDIRLKPYGKPNNLYDIRVPKITMSGIDLKEILKNSFYNGDEIIIDAAKINLKLAKGRQEKLTNLDLGFIPLLLRNRFLGAKATTFKVNNATINFHQKAALDSIIIEVQNLNLLVNDFEVDSTTEMIPNRFMFSNEVQLQGDYLSVYNQANSDFYNINHVFLSTKDGDVRFSDLYMATDTKNERIDQDKIKFTAGTLLINGLNFFDLTQNKKLNISEIHLDDAQFTMIPGFRNENEASEEKIFQQHADTLIIENVAEKLDLNQDLFLLNDDKNKLNSASFPDDSLLLQRISSSLTNNFATQKSSKNKPSHKISDQEYLFDTLLLKSIDIDRILIADSNVKIDNPEEVNKGLVLPEIWLLAEGLYYDPISSKDTNRLFYSDNLIARFSNMNYILPDNLSSIRVDELTLNSRDSSIKADNFALIPLVSRYDYGPSKGFQSTWLKIENDSITLQGVDFLSIINHKSLNAQALNVHKLDVTIFRDKRVPFPEWQLRPLPQDNLRELEYFINLDTVLLRNGYITYQEHSEKAYTTGEVFFSDLNATILNLSNDPIRTQTHPNSVIEASAKAFGEGNIKAEFLFDLVDQENIHSYGIEVGPFDLTNFNRILVPSASVQVVKGKNEKIIMTAKANEDYSYGEMKFYYDDLKIALLNRETETQKGIGNVLGSFFANTFIIKSDNPNNFIFRKGDIFFERDKKRAIFNYWTKTFLSGVVSSIGAVNNKNKIKKMQDENLKQIKAQKEIEAKL